MISKTVSLQEASANLPELVALASRGEEVVIATGDQPVARLVPWGEAGRKAKRVFGQFRGKIHVREDFDAPLPDGFWEGRE